MPKLPTEEQIKKLVAGTGAITSLKLWISWKTGFRPIEVHDIKVKDIDLERHTINATTHKKGCGRTNKIPPELSEAIKTHILKYKLQPNDKLFKNNARHYGQQFRDARKKLAEKLKDPSLLTVKLYDLRHYFATMQQVRYHDLALTAIDMGHKDWNTTRKYMHLARLVEMSELDDQYICKGASTKDEAIKLIEAGYNYVNTVEGISLYRKRK